MGSIYLSHRIFEAIKARLARRGWSGCTSGASTGSCHRSSSQSIAPPGGFGLLMPCQYGQQTVNAARKWLSTHIAEIPNESMVLGTQVSK